MVTSTPQSLILPPSHTPIHLFIHASVFVFFSSICPSTTPFYQPIRTVIHPSVHPLSIHLPTFSPTRLMHLPIYPSILLPPHCRSVHSPTSLSSSLPIHLATPPSYLSTYLSLSPHPFTSFPSSHPPPMCPPAYPLIFLSQPPTQVSSYTFVN